MPTWTCVSYLHKKTKQLSVPGLEWRELCLFLSSLLSAEPESVFQVQEEKHQHCLLLRSYSAVS
jgi:hypothetical protein